MVATGDTYSYAPHTNEAQARRLWVAPPAIAYVALQDDQIMGTYCMRPNQPGLGDHVANAGFMVAPHCSRRGVGRAMGEHALQAARQLGFHAMQFNYVVSSNERALALWKSLGFAVVGTVPKAFRHAQLGLIDIHVMHRFL